jgi:23S rRNA pseudouridine1911/1915/1917 synthase
MKLKAEKENQNIRLDKFLTANLPQFSRSQIQKMVKNGEILVNGKVVAPHYFLKIDDEIESKTTNNKRQTTPTSYKLFPTFLIHETPDYLIINKPSSLAVHPAPGIKEATLVDYLLEKYPEIRQVGEDPSRPGIVHRLDKDVSGLMVVTKTNQAFEHLKKQFQERKVKKEYLALIYGNIEKDEGIIDFPIGRAASGKMAARAKSAEEEGKRAITEFQVINRYQNFTLVKASIKTGRTHQIRVHFLAYGHPVVGDKLYKPKKIKLAKLERPFLHSSALGFYDMANQWVEFKSDLPEKLKNFLKQYEKR